MTLIRKAELIEYYEKEQCRLRGTNAPLIGARYEAWFTSKGKRFHEKGRYPRIEGLMIKEGASPVFYHMLVRLAGKIGDEEGRRMEVSEAGIRCIASLSIWSQDLGTVSELTGISVENVGRIASELCRAGYLGFVERGGRTKMALTAKGWRAGDELVGDEIHDEVLGRAIEIFTAREIECLREGRSPHI